MSDGHTVAEHLVGYLAERGVRHIFGLCGHTNIAVLSALEHSPIEFVNVRHEQIASHAADGYARATGRAGVVLSHLSPGLTNAATGVANAALDCIPMVVIAGDVPTHYFGKHPHQEVNLHADGSQYEIYRPFVKRAWRVDDPNLLPEIMERAFTLAESGQPGPVLVDVPMDVFSAPIDPELFRRQLANTKELRRPALDEETAAEIVRALGEAERPVLYVGGGVTLARANDELRAFVDHMGIPVAHSLMGKGALPDDHPLVLGMTGFWGTALTNQACMEADVMMAIGARFKEADSSSWYRGYTFEIPPTRLIHIDIDPSEIGRNYPVEIGAVADARAALATLTRVARQIYPEGRSGDEMAGKIARTRQEFAEQNRPMATSSDWPMMPERILADTRAVLPRDAYLTTDVGWNKNGVGQQFAIHEPGTMIAPGGMATMGFGHAAVLGVKYAAPRRAAVALIGDGCFSSNMSVLATAVEADLPVVWVVMDNAAYGVISGIEKRHLGNTHGCMFEAGGQPYFIDYAAVAEACGARGIRIEAADQLAEAMQDALSCGKPTLIQVPVQLVPTPTTGHWDINRIFRKPTQA